METDYGAEDLEDGELWLPSDFFSMEEAQTSSTNFNKIPFCMDDDFDLINGSASFAFLSPHNPALFKPLQTLQVDAFMGERAWALELHRQHQNRVELNRVRPGTGVFLPQISGTATVGLSRNRMGQGSNYKRELPPRKRMLNRRPND